MKLWEFVERRLQQELNISEIRLGLCEEGKCLFFFWDNWEKSLEKEEKIVYGLY